jgi:hypothetical protein
MFTLSLHILLIVCACRLARIEEKLDRIMQKLGI